MLVATHVSHAYGKRHVLADVGFTPLQRGRLTALIGPNASGKSTLFRIIAGIQRASGGADIRLDEENLDDLSQRQRLSRICFMPQFFASNAALSVFDVVLMASKQLSRWAVTEEDVHRVSSALQQIGIAHLAEAFIGELSGGQAQLVSVCQAMVRNADVYLFDEPTSALDLRRQLEVLNGIREAMVERNAIGIVALHDLNLAARFTDHLLLLGDGRIQAEGPAREVLRSELVGSIYDVTIRVLEESTGELHVYASL